MNPTNSADQKAIQVSTTNPVLPMVQPEANTLIQQGGIAVAIILSLSFLISILMGKLNHLIEIVLTMMLKRPRTKKQ